MQYTTRGCPFLLLPPCVKLASGSHSRKEEADSLTRPSVSNTRNAARCGRYRPKFREHSGRGRAHFCSRLNVSACRTGSSLRGLTRPLR